MNCHRGLRLLILVLAILTSIQVPCYAVPYTATLLGPTTATTIYGDTQGGIKAVNFAHAALWKGTATSVVDLNPPTMQRSYINSIFGNVQVGGGGSSTGFGDHALLWSGTANSAVDLNPSGFSQSVAEHVYQDEQVGYGLPVGAADNFAHHALLWRGSAGSVVDLNPAGFNRSEAYGVFDNMVVGYGSGIAPGGVLHAMLWHSAADTATDLHPIWASDNTSEAFSAFNDTEVGAAPVANGNGVFQHATLWHGSAASAVDLHPLGFSSSEALSVNGNFQVGYGLIDGVGAHALLWNGTAAGAVDLHQYLNGLPVALLYSFALDISSNGQIVGYGFDSNFNNYALLWTPVPEPSTCVILLLGLSTLVPLLRLPRTVVEKLENRTSYRARF